MSGKYKIIREQDPDSLTREIEAFLCKGWKVSGSLIYGEYSNGVKFWAQAIVRDY